MPDLTPEEVERFVALGKEGWERFRSGDVADAEAAFRGQIRIFPPNPEPFVSLALLESSRGSKQAAVAYLRDAVVRGFTDLRRIDRAEVWIPIRGNLEYLRIQDALPTIIENEKTWPEWSTFRVLRAPADLETVLRHQARKVARIDEMAPALGPRLTRLWKRLLERLAGSRLEAYVAQNPQAQDLADALDHLMTLYGGGPLGQWGRMPSEPARRLGAASEMVLERFPDSSMRPNALVGLALAKYTERDKRGILSESAVTKIRACLDEVLTRYPESAVVATAVVGLIRTELIAGQPDRAAARYRQLSEGQTGDSRVLDRVRADLGELALRLGGLPEFRATTLDGKIVSPQALRGKVAVLDFWATWCEPCVDAFPTLRRIHERHGDDVVVLGVNLDAAEDCAVEELDQWVAHHDLPGSHLHDGLSWDSDLVKTFGVLEIPFNVVVGPDGSVLAVNEHGKRLEKAVKAAVRATE
jgi:thiol-disulfide isomerase/thioredoxin